MPDLKSELVTKVLTAWNTEPEDEPTMTQMPTPTRGKIRTNLVRDTFNSVLAGPGSLRTEIVSLLVGKGHPHNSSAAMVSTLIRRGNLREVNGVLYANQTEYIPLKEPTYPLQLKDRVKKPLAVAAAPAAEPSKMVFVPDATQVVSVQDPAPWSAAAVVNGLTPRQARELYIELQQLFTV